jgi:hypothetical protein
MTKQRAQSKTKRVRTFEQDAAGLKQLTPKPAAVETEKPQSGFSKETILRLIESIRQV